jgi:WD40 repeat protein
VAAHAVHPNGICGVVSAVDEGIFLSIGVAGAIIVKEGRDRVEIGGHPGRVYLAVCDPQKRYVATVGSEGQIVVSDFQGDIVVSYNIEGNQANCVDWSSSGKFFVVGLNDGSVAVVDFGDSVALEA